MFNQSRGGSQSVMLIWHFSRSQNCPKLPGSTTLVQSNVCRYSLLPVIRYNTALNCLKKRYDAILQYRHFHMRHGRHECSFTYPDQFYSITSASIQTFSGVLGDKFSNSARLLLEQSSNVAVSVSICPQTVVFHLCSFPRASPIDFMLMS